LDEAGYLRLIRGESREPLAAAGRCVLGAAAIAYRLGVVLRNRAYDCGWWLSFRAAVPVVSVGNVTLGGTGKTPMVEYVARWYRARGLRVVILSRGYGRVAGLNDEGRVLDENLPDVPHLQDRDRARLAQVAIEELEPDLLLLDDGFQHRRLGRDLDLVLLDALDPFGLGRMCPRGLLREPPAALRRASVVVLSRADLVSAADRAAIRRRAEWYAGAGLGQGQGPFRWVEAAHAPRDLIDACGQTRPLGDLRQQGLAAFCGIGNPEGFRRTLEAQGARLLGLRTFPDHHAYAAADVAWLAGWVRDLGAELVLTTQKDLVKLRTAALGPIPLLALRIGLEIAHGADTLDAALSSLLPARE
jgi:tetraacyldisaccharide 4'-kinase